MHVAFIPYGKREHVERLLREMEAQKHLLTMTKDGQNKSVWIDGQVRMLPFGVVDYVFPKEDKDVVLTTLGYGKPSSYGMGKIFPFIRTMLKYKKIKGVKTEKKYLWHRDNVSLSLIGMKEDKELVGNCELDEGWTHEAI